MVAARPRAARPTAATEISRIAAGAADINPGRAHTIHARMPILCVASGSPAPTVWVLAAVATITSLEIGHSPCGRPTLTAIRPAATAAR